MGFKKWIVSKIDKELAKQLSTECGIDQIVSLIASSRGYSDPTELEQFISNEPFFSDPTETADIIKAAEIINTAVQSNEKIAVYGDYDCDGVTATAMLYKYLKSRGANCFYYIPDRFCEGYGMNTEAVEKIEKDGAGLIITVDNGITAIKEVETAKKLGLKVVVTDHHIPGDIIPLADAVVNPNRADCPSTFKKICGAQVAFRLICVIEGKEPEELLPEYADILTLAVIGDVMPLEYENRSIVKYGIRKIRNSPLPGIAAILNVAGVDRKKVTANSVAFGITPRINAAGRMGDAARAVELLTTDNMMMALNIAGEIENENVARQDVEKKIYSEAVKNIENGGYQHNRVIVCSGNDWHTGVIGIAAAKIAEKYGKPAILISVMPDGIAHGSGRSIENFNLFEAISNTSDLLVKFGGHELAAGVTLKADDIDNFRKSINDYAKNLSFPVPALHIDCRLNPSALTLDLTESLKLLEPYGNSNPAPLFGLWGVTLQRIIPVGNGKHLRLLFSKDINSFSAMLFGVTSDEFCFEIGDILDLAVNLEENTYKDEKSLSVFIKGIRVSGTDDDALFSDIAVWDDFLSGNNTDYSKILPSRQDIAAVYKFINEKPVLSDRIKYHFISTLGYGKTISSLKVLEELNLITSDGKNRYTTVKNAEKTNLELSPTYNLLMKGAE